MGPTFDDTTLRHLILEYIMDNSVLRRKEKKETILFDLKSKYGSMFRMESADKIYDEVMQELKSQKED